MKGIFKQNNELYNLYTILRNMCLVTKSSSTVNNFSYGPVLKFEQTYLCTLYDSGLVNFKQVSYKDIIMFIDPPLTF